MEGLNCVMLAGNLTRDPQMRSFGSGGQVCNLGLAMSRRWRTKTGEDREDVCFVDIDVFGRQAEMCGQYLHKGRSVLVEGRLHLDQWQDRDSGENRNRLKVIAQRVQFLDSKTSHSETEHPAGHAATPTVAAPQAPPQAAPQAAANFDAPHTDSVEDNIPF
jgi:single-strand DNA-binding protein